MIAANTCEPGYLYGLLIGAVGALSLSWQWREIRRIRARKRGEQ